MTRLTLFATATMLTFSGSALADTEVPLDYAYLGDPTYVEEIRDEIKTAAIKECRALHRFDWNRQPKIRNCINETTKVAEAELDEAVQQKITIASRE